MTPIAIDRISEKLIVARALAADACDTLDRLFPAKPVEPEPKSQRRLRGAARWGV